MMLVFIQPTDFRSWGHRYTSRLHSRFEDFKFKRLARAGSKNLNVVFNSLLTFAKHGVYWPGLGHVDALDTDGCNDFLLRRWTKRAERSSHHFLNLAVNTTILKNI